ncbi:MAG: hypothetical protein WD355_02945 [Balneolaceae bacterium]
MNDRLFTILLLFLFAFSPARGFGQFLTIEIEVEPETNTQVEQALNFGQVISNAGLVQINLGDPNMGVFSIFSVRTSRMLVSLETPDFLEHPDLDARIPIDLQLAYVNFGVNDFRLSEPLLDSEREIVIENPPNQPNAEWSSAYLYVYGSIDIGNVPNGMYQGDVLMSVEFE